LAIPQQHRRCVMVVTGNSEDVQGYCFLAQAMSVGSSG
jgi:hypothetical protein